MASATAIATVAVASGVAAAAAPDGQAHPSDRARPGLSDERTMVISPAATARDLATVRSRIAMTELKRLEREARRAAARRAAKRRAAEARRAARLAAQEAAQRAARKAARRAARKAAQQQSSGSAGGSATPSGDPQQIAMGMLGSYGWSSGQFGCLQSLWNRESGWNPTAENPSSGAYGIPQALPGDKMASAGADWQTNPATQIRWGLGYIKQQYGSPCGAWSHEEAVGWY